MDEIPQPFRHVKIEGGRRSASVGYPDAHVRIFEGLFCQRDPYGLHLVGGDSHPRCVHQAERYSPVREHFLDEVSRRSGNRRDDCPGLPEEGVEEGGFSHVRPAHDGHPDPLPEKKSRRAAVQQILQALAYGQKGMVRILVVSVGQVFFRKVERNFHFSREGQKFVVDVPCEGSEFPLQRPGGSPKGLVAPGTDDPEDCFRLGQVYPAGKERPFGELSWLGEAGSPAEKKFQAFLCNQGPAVGVDFHHFLTRVALG